MNEYFTLQQYLNAGCMQLELPVRLIGMALHNLTDGRMCKDCPKVNNCSALRSMQSPHMAKTLPSARGGETVRQEAIRRNIGIKEVRRQRNAASRGE